MSDTQLNITNKINQEKKSQQNIFIGDPGPPSGSDGKESACNMEDLGLILELGRSPGEENDNPLQHSCLENPGWRSLVGYNSWGHKQLNMTD